MGTTPSLAWVHHLGTSIGAAVGGTVGVGCSPTVNPLVWQVTMAFGEPLKLKTMMLVWNLFQKYAAANDSIIQGRASVGPSKIVVDVGVKTRLGLPKDKRPE